MGLLLKSLSRIDSLKPADESVEEPLHRAAKREPSRGNVSPPATAAPIESEASALSVAFRPPDPASPLEIHTSTICLTIADEPCAPSSDIPISLDALFAAPFASETTAGAARPPAVPSDLATTLDRLDQLQQTLTEDITRSQVTAQSPSRNTPQASAPPNLRPEFQELCAHLLSRFPLTKHCTFLVVDAGRAPLDHTWLLPLAAGLLDSIPDRHARALLVEVDPCSSAIAQMLGIDATSHSAAGTSDTAAFSSTYHPQIDIVRLSENFLAAVTTRLEETWTELQEGYNLILVASGPLASDTSGRGGSPNEIACSLLPLADAVILSVELGSTPVSVASQTAELLKAAGANVLGCVAQAASASE
jgi:Mrp family chromosome partitioning ATPase